MLDRIREGSQSFVVKAVLVLIALTFALAGIGGYISNAPEPSVATVNGEDITRVEFDRALENERARQQQQLGDFYDTLATDPSFNQRLRNQVVNDLVNQKLVEQYARDNGLRASDEQVREAIRAIPAFNVAGQFDNDTYRITLNSLGYTPEGFAEALRKDLARSQVLEAVVNTEFALAAEAVAIQKLVNQQRSGAYRTFALDSYLAQVDVSDDEIQQWYDNNSNLFAVPESVQVEFVALDAGAIAESITIDEQMVREWYEGNRSAYESAAQYRFSHILIEGDDAAARNKAQEVVDKLSEGADFAALAGEYSDDTFSAENGGDLDFIQPGTMDPDFEEAAFALAEVGDVSGVVETSFGFHVIKLTDKQEGSVTPFAEVRDEIIADMQDERVKQAYYEQQQKVAELAFEMPDTLQPVADEVGLQVRNSDWFNRQTAPSALNHPAVLQQVFGDTLLQERLNSDLIEVNDTQSVVVRVTDYRAASIKSLDEVREQVVSNLQQEKAQQLARADAEAVIAALRAGEAVSDLTELTAIDRRNADLPRAIVQSLFEQAAPAAGAVQADVVEMNNGGLALVQLTSVSAGDVDEATQQQMQEQLENSFAQQSYEAFLSALRDQGDVEITLTSTSNN
ncbi:MULTISPECIES: peptidylprolyl isomerase [Pseudidiomarina]|uniref:Periplasmic chaperone PpiD n=2 Tax=Pseudidiomarina TaxID=2800384 RepID=A0A368V3X6_9GAMM|nr:MULTISPECIES: peptidylprolyl isomerase [Pseudidiomarina]PWW16083.1 peptidyl-prolyl cis-trans isomerase D [Pseudidiomarina maritima]RBP93407.1 peptidyl-prolyl cis-trans isomerase D [Pseudidiomarina tainanensis]RCW35867.1 peptidyl-prolyl cis-trans isomerase D [Pseudidiomarina tainanensis]